MLTLLSFLQSIKCTDCGKQFRNQAYAQFHAEKSGHTNFEESTEEIKPLTEEEKKAKLEEMRKKLAEKRAQQSVQDKEDAKANEMVSARSVARLYHLADLPPIQIRRKAGKDVGDIKEEMKKKEADKEAARKKAEKLEEMRAKERVRAQIEADKRERAEKARIEKLKREGRLDDPSAAAGSSAASAGPSGAAAASLARPSASGASAKESRLRVRLNTGEMWTGSLDADASTLRDVERRVIDEGKSQGPKLKVRTSLSVAKLAAEC